MTVGKGAQVYRFQALTDLWTGSAKLQEENARLKETTVPDRLITTGLLGSIRWWFEVLVRGLGGSACDPSRTECRDQQHCVVCELFGCTGWARKFRFEVLDENGSSKTDQIKQDQTFSLHFTPLRLIRIEEWALLDATLRLVADYGAIGGKTVLKPTDEVNRQGAAHHRDYGLVRVAMPRQIDQVALKELTAYVSGSHWRKPDHGKFAWASFLHFWCVTGRYLGRQDSNKSTFNQMLGRQQAKTQGQQLVSRNDRIRWGSKPSPGGRIACTSKSSPRGSPQCMHLPFWAL